MSNPSMQRCVGPLPYRLAVERRQQGDHVTDSTTAEKAAFLTYNTISVFKSGTSEIRK